MAEEGAAGEAAAMAMVSGMALIAARGGAIGEGTGIGGSRGGATNGRGITEIWAP